MNGLLERVLRAFASGLIAGIVVALLVWLVSALLPGIQIDPRFWGTVVGVIVGLYTFATNDRVN